MDGMSDIRNEIEQRLGVFARQDAKETFANDTDSFLTIKGVRYRIAGTRKDSKGNLVYDLHGTSKTAHPVIYTLVKFLDDHRWVLWGAQGQEVARGKMEASRPGAKAAMGKAAALAIVGKAIDGVPAGPQRDALQKALIDYYDNTQASNRLLKQGNTTDATRFDVEAGRAVQIAVRVWDRMGKPAAELRGYTQNLERAAEFSRPGAKATMAMEAKYPQAFRDAMQMMQEFEDLEPTSALKQAASDLGIPEGAEMRKFVEWANKRIRASRPGAKAKMGILDRISRGLSAATAKPVDPTTPQYLSGLTAAKKAAEEAKSNYEYMADLNDARFKQLDNYVKVTSNMITKMNSSADIQRLIAGLKAAVAARVFVQSSMKTPFSRLGDKTEFAEGCGTGAGGFKPGNTCGKEDGKASGGGAKKKKKPTSPKPATPRLTRREERRQELENIVKARQAEERARRGTESASAPKAKRAPKVSREETARAGNDAPSLRDSEDSLNEDLRKARKMRDDVMNEGNGEGVDRLDTLVSDLELAADEERRNRGDDYDFARLSRHSMMSRLDVIANRYSARSRKINNCNVDSKPLSYGKGCETEQDKAGLKLMEKADKAVSDKIRTLIKEGKPQDQAVAIALDMKRRGEL